MKVYASENIRNISVVSHGGAGKTSLIEVLAFQTGIINRIGRVDDGNTISDYHPEEIKHNISINTSLIASEWRDTKINLLDTPGFLDFFGDVAGSLRVADTLLVVIDATSGVEVSTELIWDKADEQNLPRVVFVNKMDRENADFLKSLNSLQENFTQNICPVVLPIGSEDNFSGIIDLVKLEAYQYANGKRNKIEIPADLRSEVETYREKLIEAIAEADDDLTMKYLEGEEFTVEEIKLGLKKGLLAATVVPVIFGSSYRSIPAEYLLDFIVDYVPSPVDRAKNTNLLNEPSAALVFKTIADPYVGKINYIKVEQGNFVGEKQYTNITNDSNERVAQLFTLQGKEQIKLPSLSFGDIGAVAKLSNTTTNDTLAAPGVKEELAKIKFPEPTLAIAIQPKTKLDEDKLGNALNRILDEDPTLRLENNTETRQTLLTVMGETHSEIIIEKLKNKFGVEVITIETKIPYRETIRGSATGVDAKHKKQSGGAGQYGHVIIDIEHYPEENFAFESKVVGGSVPKQYFPAVEKGIQEAMARGILAGYPVMNIKITLMDGSYHPVDSNEMAFKIAGSMALKKGCEKAKPIILEPYYNFDITIPERYMGDIIGDINSKRGKIISMEPAGKNQVVKASVPLTEFNKYSIDLKALTQGRGSYISTFSHYEELPSHLAEKVIAEANQE